MTTIEAVPSGTAVSSPSPGEPDFQKRLTGVSASEIAAIVGESSEEDAFAVWARKTGRAKAEPETLDTGPRRWGKEAEPSILRVYSQVKKVNLVRPGTLSHPDRPWQMATPDALVLARDATRIHHVATANGPANVERGVEAKTAGFRMMPKWGDPEVEGEQDRIPSEYFLQCQYGMSVTRLKEWDVPALIGGSDFRIYTLQFDPELEEMLLSAAYEFVTKYLLPDVQPPTGWTAAETEYIKSKYPRERSSRRVKATDKELAMATRLYWLEEIEKVAEREANRVKNELKLAIGELEGIDGRGWKVTWKKNKDGQHTDWQAVATTLSNALALLSKSENELVAETANAALAYVRRYTVATEGARPLRKTLPPEIFHDPLMTKMLEQINRIKEIGR